MKSPARAAVVELINKDILAIPTTEDGKYTNIASINVKALITEEEIKMLATKAKVDASQFTGVKTSGEFYQKLVKALNKPKDEPVEKPVNPSKTT
ncbi:2,' 3'-cyclic nucleotide 2'-phosphodiesterase, partial [Clostridioides difficile]|nr:2,' 3'-cyclic nucleotide 2'-phosphodiesterase [Clostridioides difficile]